MDSYSRKSVFIGYSHKDDTENFVSRLSYSLEMYMDTFWDVKLQAGAWSEQLIEKIKQCDALLVVMSYTQKNESEWCKKELEMANEEGKVIIPVKRFKSHVDEALEQYQYADFTNDFDSGFKELTFLITGQRLTSWEYLDKLSEEALYETLKQGVLPALISKEFAEWLIVSHLWPTFKLSISKISEVSILEPCTLTDVYRALENLGQQLSGLVTRDPAGRDSSNRAKEIVTKCFHISEQIKDDNHRAAGEYALYVLEETKKYLETTLGMYRGFKNISQLRHSYSFDTSSKLRELILLHSRRSRHLY